MDNVQVELLRLRKIKLALERQENSLTKMLEVIDNQLLGLEVEDLQLSSNLREKLKEENCDNLLDNGDDGVKHEKDVFNEDETNTTLLDLDSKLDGMLSGQFYVEEQDEEEMDELE
ncbi:hypothetical protein J437_LFUL015295 [Ladona fulva]|uniref:Uncharacterized protein n=1 Tax=Ladona fulva TaxID=123851 RepID=A0A8K0KHA5_LADFU|nr:hypothetical protein J437_LFUL015295 [Ladona fulva]